MKSDDFASVAKTWKTTTDDGFSVLPDGSTLTVYVAHAGASLAVSRVDAYRSEGELLALRTTKRETFHVYLEHVYAISADGAAGGQSSRKPVGFGL